MKRNSLNCSACVLLAAVVWFGHSNSVFAQPAAAPAPVKKPTWTSSAGVGVSITRGNSDSALFTANVQSAKKWDQHEIRLGANATYGETDDVKSAELFRAFGQYNRLFGARAFAYVRAEGLHDDIADVDYRLTLGPGGGYYFIKNTTNLLSAEIGPGLVHEKQGGERTTYLTLRMAERFEHKFNDRVKLWQSLELLPQANDWNNFIVNAEIGVESSLTDKLSLRVVASDNYDHEPAPERKRNDLKIITAVTYKF